MDKTNDLINALTNAAEPVKPGLSPFGIFLRWVAYSCVYEGTLLAIYGLRPDLGQRLHSQLFVAEMILLVLIVITSGLSAVFLSFPDIHQKKWIIYLPVIPFAAFTALLYNAWINEGPVVLPPDTHGIECLLCVTMFSSFSAICIMWFLKKQATTHYYTAGAIAFLASSSFGALVFGFSEPIDSVAHLVTWHYLPMIGFMGLGMVIGRKLLRW